MVDNMVHFSWPQEIHSPETTQIHSGHFMKSNLSDSDQEEEDIINNVQQPELTVDFAQTSSETVIFQGLQQKRNSVSIDDSLTKLFRYLSLTYSGKITSPKWNEFKGMRFTVKDKIRLNNIIWREYHLQYVKGKKPRIVQFASPLSEDIHNKAESVILEGKYWKRRLETVCNEYKHWRIFFKSKRRNDSSLSHIMHEPMDITYSNEWLEQNSIVDMKRRTQADRNTSSPSFIQNTTSVLDDFLADFSIEGLEHFLQSEGSGFSFPTSKDFAQIGNSDFIQPGLVQLQPNIEDSTDFLALLTQPDHPQLESKPSSSILQALLVQPKPAVSEQTRPRSYSNSISQSKGLGLTTTPKLQTSVVKHKQSKIQLPYHQQQQQQQRLEYKDTIQHSTMEYKDNALRPRLEYKDNIQHQRIDLPKPNINMSSLEQQRLISTIQNLISKGNAPVPVVQSLIQYLNNNGINIQIQNNSPAPVAPQPVQNNFVSPALYNMLKSETIVPAPPPVQQQPVFKQPADPFVSSVHLSNNHITVKQEVSVSPTAWRHQRTTPVTPDIASNEHKRRFDINSGFDRLHSLIPSLSSNPHVKVSKAALLHKAADHMRWVKQERESLDREAQQLRMECSTLRQQISDCCARLPSTGQAGASSHRASQARRWFEDNYVTQNALRNWKFYLFALIISDAFDAFNTTVSSNAVEDFARSVLSWVDQHCSVVKLRPCMQRALTFLSTQTNVLSDPGSVSAQINMGLHSRSLVLNPSKAIEPRVSWREMDSDEDSP